MSEIVMQPTSDLSRQMAIAVEAWLDYNTSVCGEIGVQENMINHPVKAFSVLHQNEFDIQFERQHPYLSPNCHVDMYLQLKPKKNAKKKKEYYFEFKQAKEDTKDSGERSRIFYDIARLSSLASKDCRCFFMIFGTGTSFKRCFLDYYKKQSDMNKGQSIVVKEHNDTESKEKPFYSRWFVLNNGDSPDKEICLHSDELYLKFFKEYIDGKALQNSKKAIPPKKIVTKRIYISDQDKFSLNGVGLWEIIAKH